MPLAMAGPGLLGKSPFTARGMFLPLGVGALILIALVPLVVWRGPRAYLAGISIGLCVSSVVATRVATSRLLSNVYQRSL